VLRRRLTINPHPDPPRKGEEKSSFQLRGHGREKIDRPGKYSNVEFTR
jgi:hypothetical protein